MGKCLFMRKGETHSAPKVGIELSTIAEGSIVKVNESGKPVEFYVAKHDYEPTLNGTGRTLLVRKNSCSDLVWWQGKNDESAVYANSAIDAWLNSTYKKRLDAMLHTEMNTSFYYTTGRNNGTLTTLSRSVFLLSAAELGVVKGNIINEGTVLPIASAIVNNGSEYFLRTINYYYGYSAYIDTSGTLQICWSHQDTSDTPKYHPRPCFTLPSTAVFDEETLVLKGVA